MGTKIMVVGPNVVPSVFQDGEFLEMSREAKRRVQERRQAQGQKVGRNDPCPCGSGKKFKKCCLK